MFIYHTTYDYMHKKEMKHDKNYLKLQWVYQCFKNVSWLTFFKVLSTYRFFYQGINAKIT